MLDVLNYFYMILLAFFIVYLTHPRSVHNFFIIIIFFCFDRMTDLVDINFNYGGQWHYEGDELYYNNGDVDTVLNFYHILTFWLGIEMF